jgi:hypothetical protein
VVHGTARAHWPAGGGGGSESSHLAGTNDALCPCPMAQPCAIALLCTQELWLVTPSTRVRVYPPVGVCTVVPGCEGLGCVVGVLLFARGGLVLGGVVGFRLGMLLSFGGMVMRFAGVGCKDR